MRYTVVAQRSGRWWALQCVEVPGALSQARRLGEIEPLMREAIAFVADVDADSIEIDVQVAVPDVAAGHLEEAKRLREESRQANSEAAEESRAAVSAMRDQGLTLDEIAHVMGVSKGRVHQLVH